MMKHQRHVAVMITVCLMSANSAAQESAAQRASKVRATRIMQKIDTDQNGTFESHEDPATWKKYRRLDANRDQVLTIDELRASRSNYLKTGAERKLDLTYKTVGSSELKLDLYYPTGRTAEVANPYPVVVYTHGGGWAAGSKQGVTKGSFRSVFLSLLKQGFAVASVDYRLCRKGSGITMRDCVVDCKDAVRYLASNGESLKLNSNRFFVMGDSAGGHIAQMLLLTSPESFSGDRVLAQTEYTMVAGVSWYGPCDFENMDLFNHDDRPDFRDRFAPRIIGDNPEDVDKQQRYREISPINYLTKNSPPLLMIQGDKDTTIPVKHAYYMQQKAEQLNASVDVVIIRNSGHNWRKVEADIEPTREQIVERTIQYFVERR